MVSGTVLHEERAPFSFAIKAMLYLFPFFLLLLTARSWLDVKGGREGFWVLLFVTVFLGLAFWSFLNMRFRITSDGVEASMFPFSYCVRFEDIVDVSLEKPPFWVGWGLRMWWGRNIGYISMHKVSVVVHKRIGFHRNLWLSSWDSERFRDLILKEMKD